MFDLMGLRENRINE